jgi:hypothetical protein
MFHVFLQLLLLLLLILIIFVPTYYRFHAKSNIIAALVSLPRLRSNRRGRIQYPDFALIPLSYHFPIARLLKIDATRRLLEPEHSYLHVLLKTRKFYGKLQYFWTPKQSLTVFNVRCVYLTPLRIFPTTAWSLKAGSITSRSVNAILSICFCHKLLGAPFLLAWDPEPEVSVIDICPAKWSVSLKPQGV